MKVQKIINLLNDSINEQSKFATKNDMLYTFKQRKVNAKKTTLSSLKQTIKSSICSFLNAYILVTGDITVNAGNNTNVAFTNCAPFSTCKTEINDIFVDEAIQIYITMHMYKLIEYSDNYSDTSGSLCQFKRQQKAIMA